MAESSWQKKKVTNILQSLAAAYLANRQYDSAIEKFLQLKALGDDDPATCLGLAGAYLGLKTTTPEAIQSYRNFCDLYPEDGELITNIAELLLANRLHGEEALHIYRSAIAFHPPFERELHLILLEGLERRGDLPLALQAARSAALSPSSDPHAMKKLVSLSWRQKRFDELLQELTMLAEQPALAAEVRHAIAMTLAYRALNSGALLTSKELKFLKSAISNVYPVKTLTQASDYCLLMFCAARSGRPSATVEEPAGADLETANPGLPMGTEREITTKRKKKPIRFTELFFDGSNPGDENTSDSPLQKERTGQRSANDPRAVMVIAAGGAFSSSGELQLSHETSELLRRLEEGMSHYVPLRRFDDGVIAVSESPHDLIEIATSLLRNLSKPNARTRPAGSQPCLLVHGVERGSLDILAPTVSLLNTALQLTGRLAASPRGSEATSTAQIARFYVTSEALGADPETRSVVATNRRDVQAGIVGPEMEISEVVWLDPFGAKVEGHPIQLGRFVVGNKISSSQTFSTFTARDQTLGITAILKSFSPRQTESFDEEELTHAIRRVGRLTHPGLAVIHDMGKHEGIFYFVREYVEGLSLADERTFSQIRTVAKILALGVQACRALHSAHREGVLHLNLKPSNFWVSAEGKIKLTDFSLPGLHDPAFGSAADREQSHIAPELRESAGSSPASDVYALAALLFTMISRLPAVVAEDDFFAPLSFAPDQRVPERLKEVLFAAVAHDPLARPQSLPEFERQLRDCQSHLPSASA